MSLTIDSPAPKIEAPSRLRMIDCDIHPAMATPRALDPFLPAHWRQHLAEYGKGGREIYAARGNYPRFAPNTARRDAWPPSGQPPGSDLAFMQKQLLDPYDIEFGILEPLIGANVLRSIELLATGVSGFTQRALVGLMPDRARIAQLVDRSLMLVTALAPEIGYEAAAKIAAYAQAHDMTLKQAALATGLVDEAAFDRIVRPETMVGRA